MVPTQFWQAVEVLGAAGAVLTEWRHVLGDDWPWARAFLRPTGETAAWYPRLDGHYDDRDWPRRGYDVVCHGEDADDYVGVCPEHTGNVKLTRDELLVYEINAFALAARVGAALGVTRDVAEVDAPGHLWRVGAYARPGAAPATVYFAVCSDADELLEAVAGRAMAHTQPFVVLTPTTRHWRSWPDALAERGGAVVALSDALTLGGDGEFCATAEALAALRRLGRGAKDDGDAAVFRLNGDRWQLSFAALTTEANDSKGMRYLAHLLARPRTEVHASELLAEVNHEQGKVTAHAGRGEAALDADGWRRLRKAQGEARDESEEARRRGDLTLRSVAEAQLVRLEEQFRRAQGKGGRDRRIGDEAEKHRKSVSNAIERALDTIQPRHEKLWRHLDTAVARGIVLKYDPPELPPWEL